MILYDFWSTIPCDNAESAKIIFNATNTKTLQVDLNYTATSRFEST